MAASSLILRLMSFCAGVSTSLVPQKLQKLPGTSISFLQFGQYMILSLYLCLLLYVVYPANLIVFLIYDVLKRKKVDSIQLIFRLL